MDKERNVDDGMCNPYNPELRCICREEFGYKVCSDRPQLFTPGGGLPNDPSGVKAAMEPQAWRVFDGEGNFDYTDCEETAEIWKERNKERYAEWFESLYTVPVDQSKRIAELENLLEKAAMHVRPTCFDLYDELMVALDKQGK